MQLRLTSQNLDWGLWHSPEKWKRIVDDLKKVSDVIVFQEAKFVNLHKFADETWAVYQDRTSEATAGTAVMWRKSIGHKLGERLKPFVPHHNGVAMPTRYIAEVDLFIPQWGKTVTFGSFHYPPLRFKFLWPVADRSVDREVHRLRLRKKLFVYGSDFNEKVGKDVHNLVKRLGLRVRGIRIDGFASGRKLRLSPAKDLGDNASDHNPVQVLVEPRSVWRKRKNRNK
jgi:hypothetical protein